jgi:DNA-binding FadR family transcriptional regulator
MYPDDGRDRVGRTEGRTSERRVSGVHVPKVAELVAAQLRWKIVAGDLRDGDDLPRESDMLDEFGVSRPSLREALRILETEGLVRIRRGKVGGGVIRRPTTATAGYHLALTLKTHEVTHQDLAIARLSIEPICAALAAERPDREAVADELSRLVDESEATEAGAPFAASAYAFHLRLTELSGNTTMMLVAGTLEAVWNAQADRAARADRAEGCRDESTSRPRSIAAHRRLVAAIAAGRGDQASRAMRKHLADTQRLMTEPYGSRVIELAEPPAVSHLRAIVGPPGSGARFRDGSGTAPDAQPGEGQPREQDTIAPRSS